MVTGFPLRFQLPVSDASLVWRLFFLPIRLIATDIDGTLLDSRGELPEANALAIGEAAERGIEIVIVTGRRFDPARRIAQQLPCDAHLIVSNGALVKSGSGETHMRSLLPLETARRVIEATSQFRPYQGVIFDRPAERQVIFERIDWEGPFMGPYLRRHRHQVAEVAPLAACLEGEDPVEIMFIGECAPIRAAQRTLEMHERREEYTLALTEYAERGMSMLDVLRRGVTKGTALAEWARRRGIAPDEVMAIGDNWNDREMLEFAGTPVVMGNAVPELKSLGWRVTLSNDDCGVAAAIRLYALNGHGTSSRKKGE
jgi:Cof subfamily protein (haloacid dehalogenase superfamily)